MPAGRHFLCTSRPNRIRLANSPSTAPSPQGPARHHSTAALPWPGSKATLPPSCTLPPTHKVITRPCQTSSSTAALPWLCTKCSPPCFLHTSHCHTVITGEALPGIIQRLLCHGHAPKKPSPPPCALPTYNTVIKRGPCTIQHVKQGHCMKLVLMLLCLACCPVRCRVVAYLPGKAREPPDSQGNLRTVRWPRASTTTCSYCCTGRLSCWTLWSKSSEFRAGSFVLYSSKPHCCITTNLWACLAADCSLLAAQHPAD
jgi:hypothetical protein